MLCVLSSFGCKEFKLKNSHNQDSEFIFATEMMALDLKRKEVKYMLDILSYLMKRISLLAVLKIKKN